MAIPYASPSFDSVVSCLGVMFERHHQTVAKELLRMTTPRGRIGLLSGTPRPLGRLEDLVNPFVPTPQTPAPGQPPAARARPVREPARVPPLRQAEPRSDQRGKQEVGDTDSVAELDHAVVDLARDHMTRRRLMQWEYVLLTAHRAG